MLNYDNDLKDGERADEASYYLPRSGDDGSRLCCSLTLGRDRPRLSHFVKSAGPKSAGWFFFCCFFFCLSWADAADYFLVRVFMLGCKYLREVSATSFPSDFS